MLTDTSQHQLAVVDRALIGTTIRAFFEARRRGDAASMADCCTPQVCFSFVSASGSNGFHGPVIGRAGIARALRAMETEIEMLGYEIVAIIIDGARAAVRRRVTMRGRGTGVTRHFEIFDYLRMEGSLVAELEQYADTHAIETARGLSGASSL